MESQKWYIPSLAMRSSDSGYTWWKTMALIKPFYAALQISRKIWTKAFRLLRVLHENLHFTSSWQRTERSTKEKGKSGSFVKNGNKWMMIYKRGTKTERQSLEYATQLAWSSTLLWWQKHQESRATSGLTWVQKKTVTEKIGLARNTNTVYILPSSSKVQLSRNF